MEEGNIIEKKRRREKRKKRKRKEGRREKKEKKKKKKRKEKKRRRKGGGRAALPLFFRRSADQGIGGVRAPRGRGFSYSGYFMLKGHSMAIEFGPNRRASSGQGRLFFFFFFFLQFGLAGCWPEEVVESGAN